MTDARVTDRILTIPNVVSFFRLLGVAVFWWVLLVRDNVALAAVFVFSIGWTDWIDGYLARRLNQVSRLGKVLDPVADRVMIASAVVGGLIADVVPPVIGIPLIARELFMGVVTLFLISKGAGVLEVRDMGKLATFIIYGAIPSFYLSAADIIPWFFGFAGWVAGVVGMALYWWVAFTYVGDARTAVAELESMTDPERS